MRSEIMARLRRGWILVVLALVGLFFIINLYKQLKHADYYSEVFTYSRVGAWIESAKCSQVSGAFLTGCAPDGQGIHTPIEDFSAGDDRGHTLLGNILGWTQSAPVDRRSFVRINFMLNAIGIIALSLALMTIGLPFAALAFFSIVGRMAIPGNHMSADVTAAYCGILCLALVPVLWLGSLLRNQYSRRKELIGTAASFICLTWALLIREPVGKAALIIYMLTLLFRAFLLIRSSSPVKSTGSWSGTAALFALLLLANSGTSTLFWMRNHLFDVRPATAASTHGAAHNIYIGLGTEPNSFGIEWNDSDAARDAKKAHPDANYMTPLYFNTLWKLYFEIVREKPLEVIKIYLIKTFKVLNLPAFSNAPLWGLLGLFALAMGFIPKLRARFRPELHLPLLGFLALFYAQGVLALPDNTYLYPGKYGVLLMFLLLLDPPRRSNSLQCSPGTGKAP